MWLFEKKPGTRDACLAKTEHARLRNVTFSIYDRVPALLFVDLAFVIDNG